MKMLISSVLLLVVLPLAINAAPPPSCPVGKNNPVDYDHYVLTMTMPSTFCQMSKKCRSSLTNAKETKFIVHGLWPNKKGAKSPESCCMKDKLDPSVSQISGLKEIWPATRDEHHEGFWNYEWGKHGTCARAMEVPEGQSLSKVYFEATTKLVKDLNLDKALADAGYAPDDKASLTGPSKKLLYWFQDNGYKKPKIRCAEIDGKTAALEQIQFCYDLKLNPIDCDFPNLQCRPNMIVPTFKAAQSLQFKKK